MTEPSSVTVTTVVAVDPATAFEVFTDEVDLWWKTGPRYRVDPGRKSSMRFEGGAGGRLLEIYEESDDAFEHGRVLVWSPAERVVFEMGGRDFAPGESTEVEVRFESIERGTRVTVEHRGWDKLPKDHAVWHGLEGPAFHSMMGIWWADLLVSLVERANCATGAKAS
jgi:uncharacterized protein YndB with AHSA1/START domain